MDAPLFDRLTPQQIAEEINRVWLDPYFRFVVERTKHENIPRSLERFLDGESTNPFKRIE
jgi:UDP:flavonoid glycosyltransferase YjiC (YdhE family)